MRHRFIMDVCACVPGHPRKRPHFPALRGKAPNGGSGGRIGILKDNRWLYLHSITTMFACPLASLLRAVVLDLFQHLTARLSYPFSRSLPLGYTFFWKTMPWQLTTASWVGHLFSLRSCRRSSLNLFSGGEKCHKSKWLRGILPNLAPGHSFMLGRSAVPKIIYVRTAGSPENTSNIGENPNINNLTWPPRPSP